MRAASSAVRCAGAAAVEARAADTKGAVIAGAHGTVMVVETVAWNAIRVPCCAASPTTGTEAGSFTYSPRNLP